MIRMRYEDANICASCTSAGGQLLIATEIQLNAAALLTWYRVAPSGNPSALEQEAAAEAVSRIRGMRDQQAPAHA